MLVLALDSSTRGGSVALAHDGQLLEARAGDPARRQAERLPGDLLALLQAHGATLQDVSLLAAAAGPGGFTGLRVGLATMQGLALALDRRVVVVSTLELLAMAAARATPSASLAAAWMHGMRGEVFTALYRPGPHGLQPVLAPMVGTPEEAAEAWCAAGDDGPIAVTGDAWPGLEAPLQARFAGRLQGCETPLVAGVLAVHASAQPGLAVEPAAVRPAYVRRPDAVLLREQAGLPVAGDA
jgi:tRNA threonylcarbamoyladenosine biosynthesis protein TsaB